MPTRADQAIRNQKRSKKRRKTVNRAINRKIGRPPLYSEKVATAICRLVASGSTVKEAAIALKLVEQTVWNWTLDHPAFKEALARAREIRGDLVYGEQIIDIANDVSGDWKTAENGRKVPDKELVLRSKLKIEARQFHMSRLHRDVWGEKTQTNVTVDYAAMSEEQRVQKALELIGIVKELAGPRPQPPPLVYDASEGPDEEPSGIGS